MFDFPGLTTVTSFPVSYFLIMEKSKIKNSLVVGKSGEDCNRVCEKKSMSCNPEILPMVNMPTWLRDFLPNCERFISIRSQKYWTLGYPAVNGDTCIYQSKQSLLGCDGRPEGENHRICPCQKQTLPSV